MIFYHNQAAHLIIMNQILPNKWDKYLQNMILAHLYCSGFSFYHTHEDSLKIWFRIM